ncbi:MAG TPA: TIGR03943 family protein [Streptomyces sp.]|nr:TIGR03943 family protein [Streptomyces sp.]
MRRNVQVLLLVLSGAGVLHISLLSDVYLRFVKEGLRPLLIVSGVLLVGLGLVAAARDGFPFEKRPAPRAARDDGGRDGTGHRPGHGAASDHGDGHGHGQTRGPGIAWLLFLPALSLLFFTPPALGAYTAARESGDAPSERQVRQFPPLPAGSSVPLSLTEFRLRAEQDRAGSLDGRTVRLTGFVTPAGDGSWYLSRLLVSCCAADSRSVKVRVHGVAPPPADFWVIVTGRRHPEGEPGTPSAVAALDAERVRRVPEPANPYQDAAPPRL